MRPAESGSQAVLDVQVTPAMTVQFAELGPLHPVYATYEIARHFEEVGRKLLLPLLEDGEEGLGTAVSVQHLASALPGMRVRHTATLDRLEGRRLFVSVTAISELGDLLATGFTEQYISTAARVRQGFAELEGRWQARGGRGEE
ncbi:thioesterase family protein (plasmid) [Deinococcus sp. KNUC1210]|uniref:thioesterase family protein n=1 Tax=Deinococcus sp. KNUC1210 TaxID=2917691 RepID=UPI001EF044A4|nr:thioesterase family protein [Deinococcus sp. KNUC1210]ULH14244.1 thioesterase family protein [Deinococcus sp. KNUC1210]